MTDGRASSIGGHEPFGQHGMLIDGQVYQDPPFEVFVNSLLEVGPGQLENEVIWGASTGYYTCHCMYDLSRGI